MKILENVGIIAFLTLVRWLVHSSLKYDKYKLKAYYIKGLALLVVREIAIYEPFSELIGY